MAESYSRPASGFDFSFEGQSTKTVADKLREHQYALAQNIRAYDDKSIRNRPGLIQIAASGTGNPVSALRAYATLNTDNKPRYLFKSDTSSSASSVFLDNGTAVDTGYAPGLGASFIPYRPNQSPQSYMYAGDANQYRKLSAPDGTNTVVAQNVGIVEPQVPVDAGMSAQNFSYVGAPIAATYVPTGSASAITTGDRVIDTVQGVFPDPTGCGITTLQVSPNTSPLAPGIYKEGPVTAYFFSTPDTSGVFEQVFPLDPSTANQTATGNSLEFNGPSFRVSPFMPMLWGILTGGAITGSFVPWTGANQNYTMVVLANLFVPVAGNYTMTINHDDGMFFAISGATLVVGPHIDPVGHTKTAVSGYTFTGGGVAGNNAHGTFGDTYIINFPAAGIYPAEFDYAQNDVFQTLEVLSGTPGDLIIDAGSSPGYQRYMAIQVGTQPSPVTVQDVFPPLPSALGIESIFYYAGISGRCVITPASLSPVSGTDGQSLYEQNLLSGIRRGALIQIGAEVCLVLNVTNGPSGNVCFETVTQANHTAAEQLFGVSAISIFGTANTGDPITSNDILFGVGTGIGAVQTPVIVNPFVSNSFSFQPQDNVHFSMNVDNLSGLNEMKVLFDVGDGTFTGNFYYYTVRPNDIVAGISNQLTQLGVAQLVAQRATIDAEQAAESGNQGFASSSAQSTTGNSQWSEILFPISAMNRVGNDQTKSLQNVNAVQFLFNTNAGISLQLNSLSVFGGFAPDVGQVGAPYQYIIRARSSVTGAVSNPSPAMRYGVTVRRGQVSVFVPTSYPADPQADTWDVFRFGGSLTAYTYIGSVPIGSSNQFLDTYDDGSIVSSQQADYENFQPWPTIDLPFAELAQVSGSTAVVGVEAGRQANVLRYLPGNLVKIGQQVYTLWTRPTFISGTFFLFQFLENAGSGTNVAINIYEPAMANQVLPYLWGPTEEGGNVFGCGDPLRPGFVYFSKNFNPDSAPDNYNIELCPPSEPLLGGEVLNGNSYVASTKRWWQLRPSYGGQNQYTPNEVPVGRGLAAPYGIDTDGSRIFFVAKDGIYATSGGPAVSLTDADRYNLFPHEGVAGQNYTYNGITIFAPDYGRAETFRLTYCNNYLFFNYQDSTGTSRTMVYDIRHQGWSDDVILGGIGASIHYNVEQQEGSLNNADTTYGLMIVGSSDGRIFKEADGVTDAGVQIACILSTKEFTAGDERSQKLFGDIFIDYFNPNIFPDTGLGVIPMSLGVPISPVTPLLPGAARQQLPIDFATRSGLYSFSVGLYFQWFISQPNQVATLYTWQPSYINKPEITTGRAQDWDNAGYEGAKWIQGFILEANCPATKQIGVRNGDTQVLQQVFPVNQPIQSEVAYSFTQPFVAHMVRIEPQDAVDWTFFNVKWIWQRTPETVTTWWTQSSALGWEGFGHVYTIDLAYASQAPVTFTMTFDGTAQVYTLPSTAGVYSKFFLNLRANKGKLYSFHYQSTAGFSDLQLWLEDTIVSVGSWERSEPYRQYISAGGTRGDKAQI